MALQLNMTRRPRLFALAFAFLCFYPLPARSETLTLTTYYPAPYGGYVNILTTGRTDLARDADYVTIGKAGNISDKLLVNGNIMATNNISAGNVLIGGKPVVTDVVCDPPLLCTITNNTLHIKFGFPKCTGPASSIGIAGYGIGPGGTICQADQKVQYKCPVKPSIPDPDCQQVSLGASTCKGQEQSGQTCKWYKADSGDVVIGTEEYTCSVLEYEEKCAPVK
ncbi:MAG: hypothetical protein Q7R35_09800 [Elusimicrobiota bacterium]|nr:hypothetical protein [Elusimicrobiota bacterium]